jgi:hypothetical protein
MIPVGRNMKTGKHTPIWLKAVQQLGQKPSYNLNLTGVDQRAPIPILAGYSIRWFYIKTKLDRYPPDWCWTIRF